MSLWTPYILIYHHDEILLEVEIITRVSSCLSDALVLCATWYTTGSIHALARSTQTEVSLTGLLLIDGMLVCFVE